MEIILFDCQIGYGKGRFTQTLVAVRGLKEAYVPPRFVPNLITEQIDDWTLIYQPKGVLLPEEIEALVSSI